jgi:hypothetical protein
MSAQELPVLPFRILPDTDGELRSNVTARNCMSQKAFEEVESCLRMASNKDLGPCVRGGYLHQAEEWMVFIINTTEGAREELRRIHASVEL